MFSDVEKVILLQAAIMKITSKGKEFKIKAVEQLIKTKPEAAKAIDELIALVEKDADS